ncbi:hypothetical protein ABT352_22580 [Streptosporangium sp. NPDC000563]|uniref:hypothetical protein n=1 Tax=Streptosporangium sp. NPDC000563 TaxID=3154366 RepID=UPI00332BF286
MHRTQEAAEIRGRRLAIAWLETLLVLAAAFVAATLFPQARHLVQLAALALLMVIGLVCAAVSALYAWTHSTHPVALRLFRYVCAAAASAAYLTL